MKLSALLGIIAMIIASSPRASAHCDGLDGPVVQAAQQALETGNINLVLIWVQKPDEAEIKRAFDQTLVVRRLNAEARELADRYFFETLVRIHRASEGASYTGLKPAGRDLGPAIPVADKALRDGNVDEVLKLLTAAVERGVHEHFEQASVTKDFDKNDPIAGRKFVRAMLSTSIASRRCTGRRPVRYTGTTTKSSKPHMSTKSNPYDHAFRILRSSDDIIATPKIQARK